MVEWTGAPACVADVSDSSVALVTGLDTDGHLWQAWLNLDNAAALLVEEPEDVDDVSLWIATPEFEETIGHKRAEIDAEVPADAQGALIWASAAGVRATAQQSRIEELLRAQETRTGRPPGQGPAPHPLTERLLVGGERRLKEP
ncbi:hypothetical protein ACF1AX_36095 [Streptomyces sp. NPDC014802]|uniref:hypothetical protein n=1 Tax=Streptomyces sp. NPDC014802 TaxID=3364917 RepID=UPI0036FFAE70